MYLGAVREVVINVTSQRSITGLRRTYPHHTSLRSPTSMEIMLYRASGPYRAFPDSVPAYRMVYHSFGPRGKARVSFQTTETWSVRIDSQTLPYQLEMVPVSTVKLSEYLPLAWVVEHETGLVIHNQAPEWDASKILRHLWRNARGPFVTPRKEIRIEILVDVADFLECLRDVRDDLERPGRLEGLETLTIACRLFDSEEIAEIIRVLPTSVRHLSLDMSHSQTMAHLWPRTSFTGALTLEDLVQGPSHIWNGCHHIKTLHLCLYHPLLHGQDISFLNMYDFRKTCTRLKTRHEAKTNTLQYLGRPLDLDCLELVYAWPFLDMILPDYQFEEHSSLRADDELLELLRPSDHTLRNLMAFTGKNCITRFRFVVSFDYDGDDFLEGEMGTELSLYVQQRCRALSMEEQ
ncbi:hypothetical protein TREMEDRAFT_74952 [Tremella mesenterica DSM 1558]|nr:uncharacterized protein TREMEDRAFT_74952 [Tremella mesenterica DSM 1558]EIW65877.1 hypothetical protein TREMEDRAFT_74952 [Tremella mesenterica DSM 1558]